MNTSEVILRLCCLGPEGVDIPIYVGPGPSRCKWIVVTRVPDGPPADPETYVVHFVSPRGAVIDFAQRCSLQEAIDTGKILSGLSQLRWVVCRQKLDESEELDAVRLQRI